MSAVELKSRVTKLEGESEQDKIKSQAFQQEKVTEVKVDQEETQRQIVDLKKSFEDDKRNQMIIKEYQEQLRVTKREYQEQLSLAESNLKKDRLRMATKLKGELREQVEQELATSHAMERKKATQELFRLSTQLKTAEDEISGLKTTIRNKDTLLQEKEKELRSNTEKSGRSERKASKQHMDEVEIHRRQMQTKDKELSQLAEKLAWTMADKDKLVEEIKRLKGHDVRGRRSTTPTSPSLSPSASVEELTAVSKQVSRRERDMVIRNSELSFRVRTLEETASKFREENVNLKEQLTESRSRLAPLKESKDRLNKRINDLNASLRSSEKKVGSLSQETLKLKSAKQQLEEEHTRQRKSLQQQLTKSSAQRNEIQKLNGKIETLTQKNERLLQTTDRLESDCSELEQQMRNLVLTSPVPLSPPPSTMDDDDTCSVSSNSSSIQMFEDKISQIEFDKDETDIQLQEMRQKYDEMKLEYSSLRSKYKALRSTYETAQQKLRDIQASYKEELNRREQFEKERLRLESEVDMLRRASHSDSLYDQDRQEVTVESLQTKVDELQDQVDELETFIDDQDSIWVKQEKVWAEEKSALVSTLEEMKYTSGLLSEEKETLTSEFEQLRWSSQSWTEEKERLTLALENLQQSFQNLIEEKETLAKSLQASQTSFEANRMCQMQQGAHQEDISELEKTNLKLTEQLSEVLNKLASLEKESSQQTELMAKNIELSDLESAKTKLSEDLDKASKNILSLHQTVAQFERELDNEAKTNLELKRDIERVKNELKDKKIEYSDTAEELAQLQEDSKKSISSKESVPTTKRDELRTSSHSIPEEIDYLKQLTELDQQYSRKLKQKEEDNAALQDSLSLAQSNITQLNALLGNLQTILDNKSEEHLSHLNERDQHINELTEQLSQASSKLIRLRRAVPVGVNHQMASELGHKVKAALKTLSSKVRSASGSKAVQHLHSLEEAVNELLHTMFPGTFDAELTLVNSDSNLISESSATSELSSMSEQDLTVTFTPTPTTTPTSFTHSSHIAPHSSFLGQDEEDYVPPSPQSNPLAVPIKSRDISPSNGMLAWREVHRGEDKSFGNKSDMKRTKRASDGEQEARVFVAVLDYEPESMCVTGKPSDELSFNTGAVLAVYDAMDADGYYTAQFEGKTGRVPANFIQEVDVSDPAMKNRLFSQTLGSPLPTDSYMVPSRHTLLTTPTETSLAQSYTSSHLKASVGAVTTGRPNPPTHFKVDKALGNSMLMVTWQPPRMDLSDGNHSNGCLVTGYQLYVNGETKNLISGAKLTKATLVELNLSQPLALGISTCANNGKSSKVVTCNHQPKAMSTVSSPSPEPEQYRTFIALYDYDPVKSSPCDHPEFELALSEGDLLKVYGREMEDGFIVGELNGQRGLVPASFINEVKKQHVKMKDDKSVSVNDSVLLRSTSPSPPKLPGTKTLMVASFDYNPETDSPNPNPEMELSFKRGDQITVLGKMHGDGYYSGQCGDKFGLVPSNFLTKKPLSHPLSESYEGTTTPKKRAEGKKKNIEEALKPLSPDQPVPKQKEVKTKSPKRSSPKESIHSPKTKSSPKGKSKKIDSLSDSKKKRQGFRWQKS